MTKDEMLDAVVVQRRRLIDTLAALTDEQWNAWTLCEGWRVREVVAHLISVLEVPLRRFMWGSLMAAGFDRFADQLAKEIGSREPADLLTMFRSLIDARRAPPIIGPIVPLSDVHIHTRDIERPMGRQPRFDEMAAKAVLDFVCGGKARGYVSPGRTRGLRFEATDLDWSTGDGPLVTGTAEALMLAVTGRTSVFDEISGIGAPDLRKRLLAR